MKTTSNQTAAFPQILFSALFSALCSLALTFLCTLFISVLIEHAVIPESGTAYAFLAVIPGAFLAGLLTARRAGRQMLLYGLLGGAVFFLLLLLLSALLLPGLSSAGSLLPTLLCTLAASALGAILAPGK